MIVFTIQIAARDGRPSIDVSAREVGTTNAHEEVAANIMHHALQLGTAELAAQIAAGELVWDESVKARLTRRPK